jgi:serine/threonine-protein kinase
MNSGDRLGPYEIVEQLGAGGMGEVWLATDPRLDRNVAIKVLPQEFAADAERLARFEREAKLLAQLNHPNIAGVYGLEEADGQRFIAMECVEGSTLADRIEAEGPIAADESLELARQLAEGLEMAHEAGIVHRDLKPANIMVTPAGKVKVLDFGLAKAWQGGRAGGSGSAATLAELSHSPTTMAATQAGVILGTAAYMSPEQARGRPADRRADVWAFGCVLFEMLTGSRAFGGDTVSDMMAAILKEEPDWKLLPAAVPRSVGRVLWRCLRKDPRERLHDIADARIGLTADDPDTPFAELGTGAAAGSRRATGVGGALLWAAAGLMVGVLATSVLAPGGSDSSGEGSSRRLSVTLPASEAMSGGPSVLGSDQRLFDVSPDGRSIAYTAAFGDTTRLYLRRMGEFDVVPIPGTEDGYHPFFSPDGQWLGFFSGSQVRKVRLGGGDPETVTSATQLWSAAWSDDGWIYLLTSEGQSLSRVPESSGPAELLFRFWDRRAEFPPGQAFYGGRALQAIPAGAGLVISMSGLSLSANSGYAVHYSPSEGRITFLKDRAYEVRYSRTGHLLFMRGAGLYAAPMDLATLTVAGPERMLAQNVRSDTTLGTAAYDVAGEMLVYASGGDHGFSLPVWVDMQGNSEPLPLPPRQYGTFRLSPDGLRLAIVVAEASDNIYLFDMERGGTFDSLTVTGVNTAPAWAPDGTWLAYASARDGRHAIYRRWIDGRPEELLFESDTPYAPYSFSPDGSVMLISSAGDLLRMASLQLQSDGAARLVPDVDHPGWGPMFSPDGRWIGSTSWEAGVYNVYLRQHPGAGGAINLSGSGGEEPVFSPDGRRVFYRWGADWFVVDLAGDAGVPPSRPRLLFRRDFINVPWLSYDIAPDGERLLALEPVSGRPAMTDLRVVVDWPRLMEADGS